MVATYELLTLSVQATSVERWLMHVTLTHVQRHMYAYWRVTWATSASVLRAVRVPTVRTLVLAMNAKVNI